MFKRTLSGIMLTLLLVGILISAFDIQSVSVDQTQEYPVPREQVVIMETDTSYTVLDRFNPFIPMGTQWGSGWHQVVNEWDWYINYATGQVIYWRITGWDYQANYTTFIMHVREGVKWNDGEPYTANDIAFTLNMLKENDALFGHAYVDEWVESAEATDDYTAVIKLKKPNPRFHHNFRMWGGSQGNIVPEHIWKDVNPEEFTNFPPTETGPYVLYNVYPDLNMFIWERDEDYWAKDLGYFPAPKYVIWRLAPPPDIDLEDFVAGMVDAPLPHLFSWDMIQAAMARTPNVTIAPFLDPCPLGISAFNLDVYPLNVREVRWAIAYCLNREKLSILYPLANGTDVSPYPWPIPKYGAFDKYLPMAQRALQRIEEEYGFTFEYNTSKAAEILDGIDFIDRDGDGWRETPNGTVLSFELVSRPQTVVQEYYIAADLVEELRNIGIDASVRTVDPAMWHEFTSLGEYDIATGSLCTPAWLPGDMVYALDALHGKWYRPIGERYVGGGIHGAGPRYKNPELDALIDQLWVMGADDPAAQDLYEEAIYIMMRDLVTVPAVEKAFVQAFSTYYWTGWPSEDNMYHVPYIWWPEFNFVLFQIEPVKPPVPKPTKVRFSLDPNPAIVGSLITLLGNLTTEDDYPISGATIIVRSNSTAVATLKTNSTGWLRASGRVGSAGTFNITLEYAGSIYYLPSSDWEILVVNKAGTEIYAKFVPNPVNYGETCTLKGVLLDQFSHPIGSATVTLEYSTDYGSTWNPAGTLTTNYYGIFSKTFTAPSPRTYIVRVSYSGSPSYESSTADIPLIVLSL